MSIITCSCRGIILATVLTITPLFATDWITTPPSLTPATIVPVATATTHLIDARAGRTDAQIASDLQAALSVVEPWNSSQRQVVIRFNATKARTVVLPSSLHLDVAGSANASVVIDGEHRITCSGAGARRILGIGDRASSQGRLVVTVQRLGLISGRHASEGGALRSGTHNTLHVLECTFVDNRTWNSGPDIGGGAIQANMQRALTISGCTFSACRGSNGGAINVRGAALTVLYSTFTGNQATGSGGGAEIGASGQGGIGGAIYVDGIHQSSDTASARIERCVFGANTANAYAGAIHLFTYAPGWMGATKRSIALVNACTFADNRTLLFSAGTGNTGGAGGLFVMHAELTVSNSTFSGNRARSMGGGLWNATDAKTAVLNCTFSDNRTDALTSGQYSYQAGALWHSRAGTLWVSNSTFAGNRAGDSSAAVMCADTATWHCANSVFDGNGTTRNDVNATVKKSAIAGGPNLQWPHIKPVNPWFNPPYTPVSSSQLTYAPAQLGALGNHGGPTPTHLPAPASPCIDAGNTAVDPTKDQRGNPRQGPPDLGSAEVGSNGSGNG